MEVKSWKDYCAMHLDDTAVKKFFSNDKWEICVSPSDGKFEQVSFVNAIKTTDEKSTHVT